MCGCDIIFIVAGFSDIKTINNISSTCKFYNKLRLQRLFYGFLIAKYFNGSIKLFIKNSYEITDIIKSNDYKLSDYIYDIFSQVSCENISYKEYNKQYRKYNYPRTMSCNFITLTYYYSSFKNELSTYKEYQTDEIFRLPVFAYRRLRRHNLGVLALIY